MRKAPISRTVGTVLRLLLILFPAGGEVTDHAVDLVGVAEVEVVLAFRQHDELGVGDIRGKPLGVLGQADRVFGTVKHQCRAWGGKSGTAQSQHSHSIATAQPQHSHSHSTDTAQPQHSHSTATAQSQRVNRAQHRVGSTSKHTMNTGTKRHGGV